jgi:hypothetical protein
VSADESLDKPILRLTLPITSKNALALPRRAAKEAFAAELD